METEGNALAPSAILSPGGVRAPPMSSARNASQPRTGSEAGVPMRTLRVATWNIHGGIGRDGRYDASRILGVLQQLGADIIALQEVASLAVHNGLLGELRTSLGLHVVGARTLTRRQSEYGNALLSRFALKQNTSIALTVGSHEPRNAIDAHLDVDGRDLRVLTTHLGLRPAERRIQVQKILRAIDQGPDVPTVMMGDVNEWYLWGRPLRWLHARFGTSPSPRTFPASRPMFALDRIWTHPAGLLNKVTAHRSALAREASDHLPVVGEMQWRPAGTDAPHAIASPCVREHPSPST